MSILLRHLRRPWPLGQGTPRKERVTWDEGQGSGLAPEGLSYLPFSQFSRQDAKAIGKSLINNCKRKLDRRIKALEIQPSRDVSVETDKNCLQIKAEMAEIEALLSEELADEKVLEKTLKHYKIIPMARSLAEMRAMLEAVATVKYNSVLKGKKKQQMDLRNLSDVDRERVRIFLGAVADKIIPLQSEDIRRELSPGQVEEVPIHYPSPSYTLSGANLWRWRWTTVMNSRS